MARYVREGVEVLVVSCTGGERGDDPEPALAADEASMTDFARDSPSVRRREMAARQGDPRASSTPGSASSTPASPRATRCRRCPRAASRCVPLEEASRAAGRLVREFRPHVDDDVRRERRLSAPRPHHAATRSSVEAFEAAADPDRYPGTGEPWQPLKLYYHLTFHKRAHRGAARRRRGRRPRLAVRRVARRTGRTTPSTPSGSRPSSTCARLLRRARRGAARPTRTQVDPTGRWFLLPTELQQAAWPTEDYELARSLVETAVPEDDLFAGVRSLVRSP